MKTDTILQRYEAHFAPPDSHNVMFLNLLNGRNKVVATCQLHSWDTDTPSLCWLFVPEDERRKGYGRRLFRAAVVECLASGKNTLNLTVRRGNTNAEHLYRSEGFTHYQQDNDNLYMVRLLKPTPGVMR